MQCPYADVLVGTVQGETDALGSHVRTALCRALNPTQGLWTKHVQYFLDAADDTSITAKYSDFLTSQHVAVHDNAMNATADVGSVWYAPNEGGSEWGPQPSASGLEAVLSATKVCHVVHSTGTFKTTDAIL